MQILKFWLLLLGLTPLPLACATGEGQRPAKDGRPPTQGVTLAYPCRNARAYEYDALLPTGVKASELVAELGKLRSAAEARKHFTPEAGAAPPPPRVLSLSFEGAGDQVTYQDDCGAPLVNIPVLLAAQVSGGERWQAKARLQVKQDRTATVRVEDEQAPFQLNARLTQQDLDVELTPRGAVTPTRFSTLCGVEAAPSVASSLGVELPKLVAPAEVRSFSCAKPNGTRARLDVPMSAKLIEHDTDACAPQAGAPATFDLAVAVNAAWAEAPLRGQGTLTREDNAFALQFRVHGKARASDGVATLLPCAANDANVSVAFEGGARGPAPGRREPYKLTFTFSCEDVRIECTAE